VPGSANVCSNVAPLWSVPLPKVPSLADTVCGATPVLVHVTVVPGSTLSVAGSKARSTMSTASASAARAGVAVGAGFGVGVAAAFGAAPAASTTRIVPCISGWKMHRKSYVPALAKDCLYEAPGLRGPLSMMPPVAVCSSLSWLRNVTVPPVVIVVVDGWTTRSPRVTVADLVGFAALGADPPEFPPPTTIRPWYRLSSSSRSSMYVYVPGVDSRT
jgi:hypothetical protein